MDRLYVEGRDGGYWISGTRVSLDSVHRSEVDAYLEHADAEFEALRRATHGTAPELAHKLAAARRQMQMAGS